MVCCSTSIPVTQELLRSLCISICKQVTLLSFLPMVTPHLSRPDKLMTVLFTGPVARVLKRDVLRNIMRMEPLAQRSSLLLLPVLLPGQEEPVMHQIHLDQRVILVMRL